VSDYRLVVEFVTCYSGLGVRTISENPEIGIVRPLTVADIAERLQVSTRTVLQRIKESGVAFAPPGRSCRFSEDDYKLLFEATLRRSRSSSKPLAGFSSQGEITRAVEKQSRSRRTCELNRKLRNRLRGSGASSTYRACRNPAQQWISLAQ
jgi:excisionase family DNA binding protein